MNISGEDSIRNWESSLNEPFCLQHLVRLFGLMILAEAAQLQAWRGSNTQGQAVTLVPCADTFYLICLLRGAENKTRM